jgi:hypothetical protein
MIASVVILLLAGALLLIWGSVSASAKALDGVQAVAFLMTEG